MSDYLYPQFRDEQLRSRYPFADAATLVTKDGLAIDPAMFLDASIYPIGAGARVGIAGIDVAPGSVTLRLGDAANSALATAIWDPASPPAALGLADARGRPAGLLVADPTLLAALASWPAGSHNFALGAAEFAASCAIPTPEPGLRGLVDASGATATGDVWLIGINGVVLSLESGAIRVDIVGDPYYARTLCADAGGIAFTPPVYLRTINGIGPDAHGNFTIIPVAASTLNPVLRVYAADAGTVRFEAFGQPAGG